MDNVVCAAEAGGLRLDCVAPVDLSSHSLHRLDVQVLALEGVLRQPI